MCEYIYIYIYIYTVGSFIVVLVTNLSPVISMNCYYYQYYIFIFPLLKQGGVRGEAGAPARAAGGVRGAAAPPPMAPRRKIPSIFSSAHIHFERMGRSFLGFGENLGEILSTTALHSGGAQQDIGTLGL